jgi:hypothetical protein
VTAGTYPPLVSQEWRLVVPAAVPLVTYDDRSPARTRQLHEEIAWQARQQQIPWLPAGTVICLLRMPGLARFRPEDWTPSVHAAADALITAGVFDDLTAMTGPELRGASGLRAGRPQLTIRVLTPGRPAPPPLRKHLAGRMEDYDEIGGDDLHYLEVAELLDVTGRTVLRWRARRRGITLT